MTNKIFISNLVSTVRAADLRALLLPCGEVFSVRIASDKSRPDSLGLAFIEMQSEEAKLKALQLDGQLLHGRPMHVTANDTLVQLRVKERPVAPASGGFDRRNAAKDELERLFSPR